MFSQFRTEGFNGYSVSCIFRSKKKQKENNSLENVGEMESVF
jgi:hypothetical protein